MEKKEKPEYGKVYETILGKEKFPIYCLGERYLLGKRMYEFAQRIGAKTEQEVIRTTTIPKENVKVQKKLVEIIPTFIHEDCYYQNSRGEADYLKLNQELNKVGL